jgi:hypothetical protein
VSIFTKIAQDLTSLNTRADRVQGLLLHPESPVPARGISAIQPEPFFFEIKGLLPTPGGLSIPHDVDVME